MKYRRLIDKGEAGALCPQCHTASMRGELWLAETGSRLCTGCLLRAGAEPAELSELPTGFAVLAMEILQ